MQYTVRFRHSCAIVEDASLLVDADSAAEALEKGKWLADNEVDLEWCEDADQYEELERAVWVIDPSRVMILGAGCISTDDSNPSGTGETPVASTKS